MQKGSENFLLILLSILWVGQCVVDRLIPSSSLTSTRNRILLFTLAFYFIYYCYFSFLKSFFSSRELKLREIACVT